MASRPAALASSGEAPSSSWASTYSSRLESRMSTRSSLMSCCAWTASWMSEADRVVGRLVVRGGAPDLDGDAVVRQPLQPRAALGGEHELADDLVVGVQARGQLAGPHPAEVDADVAPDPVGPVLVITGEGWDPRPARPRRS